MGIGLLISCDVFKLRYSRFSTSSTMWKTSRSSCSRNRYTLFGSLGPGSIFAKVSNSYWVYCTTIIGCQCFWFCVINFHLNVCISLCVILSEGVYCVRNGVSCQYWRFICEMTYHRVRNDISFSWLRSCLRWPLSYQY